MNEMIIHFKSSTLERPFKQWGVGYFFSCVVIHLKKGGDFKMRSLMRTLINAKRFNWLKKGEKGARNAA